MWKELNLMCPTHLENPSIFTPNVARVDEKWQQITGEIQYSQESDTVNLLDVKVPAGTAFLETLNTTLI